jgi:hypothetical protein
MAPLPVFLNLGVDELVYLFSRNILGVLDECCGEGFPSHIIEFEKLVDLVV